MPACATSPSHDRFSADIFLNHGSRSSIAAIAAVPSAPIDRSIRRTVSGCTRAGASSAPAAACRLACIPPPCHGAAARPQTEPPLVCG